MCAKVLKLVSKVHFPCSNDSVLVNRIIFFFLASLTPVVPSFLSSIAMTAYLVDEPRFFPFFLRLTDVLLHGFRPYTIASAGPL